MELWKGDCLELMKNIPDCSVDLILADPPYGTMDTDGGRKIGIHGWDKCIPPVPMFTELSRLLRPNGKMALFSQEPYTSDLITSALPSLPFCYRAIWKKDTFGNCLGVNENMVSYFEDVLIFSKICPKHDFGGGHPLRTYFLQERDKCGDVNFRKLLGNGMAGHYFTQGAQFALPTRENYKKLQSTGNFCRDYDEIKAVHDQYQRELIEQMNARYPSIFNLWEGGKSKSNVLEYAKDNDGYHPTQKPVALLEDLIKTFSNPDSVVLDFTMGSGSTGVACVNTGRRFIGIELDDEYYSVACQRIEAARTKGSDNPCTPT